MSNPWPKLHELVLKGEANYTSGGSVVIQPPMGGQIPPETQWSAFLVWGNWHVADGHGVDMVTALDELERYVNENEVKRE